MANGGEVWGVVGYRNFSDHAVFSAGLEATIAQYGAPSRVVSGGATGADAMAKRWAAERGIPFTEHLPKAYTAQGLLARNTLIANDCTILVAFPSTESRGTFDTIRKAQASGKKVVILKID